MPHWNHARFRPSKKKVQLLMDRLMIWNRLSDEVKREIEAKGCWLSPQTSSDDPQIGTRCHLHDDLIFALRNHFHVQFARTLGCHNEIDAVLNALSCNAHCKFSTDSLKFAVGAGRRHIMRFVHN